MKKLLAVAVLATSAAYAADSRSIYDIQYLPNAGTTYGQTVWSMAKQEQEFKGGAEREISGWNLEQVVGHSFTDRLSAQIEMDYLDAEVDPKGGSKSDVSGLSDPTVSARYRVMDESWRLDVLGGALISLGDSKVKSNGDRDNREGGHDLFAGVQLGQRWEDAQWAVSGIVKRHMDSTVDNSGGAADDDYKASNDLLLRADYLRKLAEKSIVRAHLSTDFVGESEHDDNGQDIPSSTEWELGAEYNHLFSNDLMAIAGVDYQMDKYDSADLDSDNAWVFNFGARYQF